MLLPRSVALKMLLKVKCENRALLLYSLADSVEALNDEEPELTGGGSVASASVARGKP